MDLKANIPWDRILGDDDNRGREDAKKQTEGGEGSKAKSKPRDREKAFSPR